METSLVGERRRLAEMREVCQSRRVDVDEKPNLTRLSNLRSNT